MLGKIPNIPQILNMAGLHKVLNKRYIIDIW